MLYAKNLIILSMVFMLTNCMVEPPLRQTGGSNPGITDPTDPDTGLPDPPDLNTYEKFLANIPVFIPTGNVFYVSADVAGDVSLQSELIEFKEVDGYLELVIRNALRTEIFKSGGDEFSIIIGSSTQAILNGGAYANTSGFIPVTTIFPLTLDNAGMFIIDAKRRKVYLSFRGSRPIVNYDLAKNLSLEKQKQFFMDNMRNYEWIGDPNNITFPSLNITLFSPDTFSLYANKNGSVSFSITGFLEADGGIRSDYDIQFDFDIDDVVSYNSVVGDAYIFHDDGFDTIKVELFLSRPGYLHLFDGNIGGETDIDVKYYRVAFQGITK